MQSISKDLVRGLNSLELWNELLFFAGIAVGMVKQGEFAVLLLHFLDSGGNGEFEVGICRAWSVCGAGTWRWERCIQ